MVRGSRRAGAQDRRPGPFQGAPVLGAVVSLHGWLAPNGPWPAITRSTGIDGTFDFGVVPPTWYHLTASAAGRTAAIAKINVADPTLEPPSDQQELRLGNCTASIAGTVFDATGAPIPRARIRRGALVGVDSDEHGRYLLCVPRGDNELTYSADGYGSVLLTIDVQGSAQQDAVLVPEATLTGRVVDVDGHGVANALINAFAKRWGRDREAEAHVLSDSDGRFHLAGLVPARYRLAASADTGESDWVDAVAGVGVPNAEVVIRLMSTARVKGNIVSGGRPVAGATILASRSSPTRSSPPTISQGDGSFVIESRWVRSAVASLGRASLCRARGCAA